MRRRSVRNGFTLVEMMVALTIFGLLSAAGVGLLRSSVDTQSAVERRLADLSSAARVRALLTNDLVQVVDRPTRQAGAEAPAFVGLAGEMRFVRAGWTDLGETGRPDLQAVRWSAGGGTLARTARTALDGGADGTTAAVLRELEQASFRYRGQDGQWRSSWSPRAADAPLPAAVELTLRPRGAAVVTVVVALPPLPAPEPLQLPGTPAA